MRDPNWLDNNTYWRLTVAFWPEAVRAGVHPVKTCGYLEGPQYYRPRDIDFHRPPSREEFLQVVRQTPWMRVWEQDLLPVIAGNDWPMIDPGHKASHVYLQDSSGRTVGQLDVTKQEFFQNTGYQVPMITVDDIELVCSNMRKENREAAHQLIRSKENQIQERLARSPSDPVAVCLRDALREAGLLKSKKRKNHVSTS